MPELFGTGYTRAGLLRRVGRLEQVAGVRLVTIGDGQGPGRPGAGIPHWQWLAPGETRHYDLEIGALPGAAAIGQFADRVTTLTVG
jgi:hypothetical protein